MIKQFLEGNEKSKTLTWSREWAGQERSPSKDNKLQYNIRLLGDKAWHVLNEAWALVVFASNLLDKI